MPEGTLPSFNCFPEEIVVRILHFCESQAILRFAATCKSNLKLVTESISLQLHIELEVNALEIIKGSSDRNADYATILADLRRYRDAWLDLDLTPQLVKCVDHPRMVQWDLRDGVFIKDYSASGDDDIMDSLELIPLDSPNTPSSVCFHYNFQDFSIDLSQGLAILVGQHPEHLTCAHIHLRSISTGLPHPLAQKSILTAELDFNVSSTWTQEIDTFDIKVMGNLLLTKFTLKLPHRYELLVWSWVEGVLLYRICASGVCDFGFLDKEHLVLSSAVYVEELQCLHSIVLLIFDISTSPSNRHSPPDGHFNIPTYSTLEPVLKLEFLRVLGSLQVSPSRFMLRSDPNPGRFIHASSATLSCSHSTTLGLLLSLEPRPTETIEAVQTDLDLCIFISGDHLLEHLKQRKSGGTSTTTLLWHEWGENATRWFAEADELDRWTCWLSGSRFINAFTKAQERSQMVSVFDFNTSRVRRHSGHYSKYCSPTPRTEYENEEYEDAILNGNGLFASYLFGLGTCDNLPDEMPDSEIMSFAETVKIETIIHSGFEEPVISRLPYRIVTKAQAMPTHVGWMIDGDHIIGVYPRINGHRRISIYSLRLSNGT